MRQDCAPPDAEEVGDLRVPAASDFGRDAAGHGRSMRDAGKPRRAAEPFDPPRPGSRSLKCRPCGACGQHCFSATRLPRRGTSRTCCHCRRDKDRCARSRAASPASRVHGNRSAQRNVMEREHDNSASRRFFGASTPRNRHRSGSGHRQTAWRFTGHPRYL